MTATRSNKPRTSGALGSARTRWSLLMYIYTTTKHRHAGPPRAEIGECCGLNAIIRIRKKEGADEMSVEFTFPVSGPQWAVCFRDERSAEDESSAQLRDEFRTASGVFCPGCCGAFLCLALVS